MAEEYLLYDVDGTAAKVMRYVKHRISSGLYEYLLQILLPYSSRVQQDMAENIVDYVNDVPVQDIGYQSADEALAQIKEKEYALPYKADKRKLFEIGVNFASQSRSLQEWKVAE
jgi:hypothetical protein